MITLLTAFALHTFDADWGWWAVFGAIVLVEVWLSAVGSRS